MSTATHTLDERIRRMTPVAAPPEQRPNLQALSGGLAKEQPAQEYTLKGPSGEFKIPESVFRLLVRMIEIMAKGDAVTLVPVGKVLTTQQAADLLNVSRQYLVRLLDEGAIPYQRTGKHRRLRIEDVLAFKEERDRKRMSALAELTQFSEDCGNYFGTED